MSYFKDKCIKFDFVCGYTPDPADGAYVAPSKPIARFKGLTSKAEKRAEGKRRKGERQGEEGKKKGKRKKKQKRKGRRREEIEKKVRRERKCLIAVLSPR